MCPHLHVSLLSYLFTLCVCVFLFYLCEDQFFIFKNGSWGAAVPAGDLKPAFPKPH